VPWAKLQGMLQGMLQAAGSGGYLYKVLTGRFGFISSFWAFYPGRS
jgi:hypothetical protein